MSDQYYRQRCAIPETCIHCGEVAEVSEVRDLFKHNVLDTGCDPCLDHEGWE